MTLNSTEIFSEKMSKHYTVRNMVISGPSKLNQDLTKADSSKKNEKFKEKMEAQDLFQSSSLLGNKKDKEILLNVREIIEYGQGKGYNAKYVSQ